MVFTEIKHFVKMVNDLQSKWPMVFSQMEHLIKMAKGF